MKALIKVLLALLHFLIVCASTNVIYDQYYNDKIHYSLSYLSNDQLSNAHDSSAYSVTTSDAENYQCILPQIEFSVCPFIMPLLAAFDILERRAS